MKKIIVFIICAILCSCDSSKRKEVGTENMEAPTPEQTKSEPKIVDRVTVMAEVFHYIDNYDGTHIIRDANRKEKIEIIIYDDGLMYMANALHSIVRYSSISGYEYECNIHNNIWAFNKGDKIN